MDISSKVIQAAGKIDGVLLHLHGAMVTDDLDDGEGHVLEAFAGWSAPIFPSSPPWICTPT